MRSISYDILKKTIDKKTLNGNEDTDDSRHSIRDLRTQFLKGIKRHELLEKIRDQGRYPVIIELYPPPTNIHSHYPLKLLGCSGIRASTIIDAVKTHLYADISDKDSLYINVNDVVIRQCEDLGEVYNKYKNDEGYLYVTVIKEPSFG